MTRFYVLLFCTIVGFHANAQPPQQASRVSLIHDIVSTLASDSLKGRGNYTPELQKAADFIELQFLQAGLQTLPGNDHFAIPINFNYHPASLYQLTWNGNIINGDDYLLMSPAFFQPVFNKGTYQYSEWKNFPTGEEWASIFFAREPQVVNLRFTMDSLQLKQVQAYRTNTPVLLVNDLEPLESMDFSLQNDSEKILMNIVGILPGKSLAGEIVMFSAHYDHMPPSRSGKDSIYNGANDNASGTAALLMLAKHFAEQNNNERTLIFCAFAGEELGLLGSRDLVKKINTANMVAMINMDMVGISDYNRKGFLLTGTYRSQLHKILKLNLEGHDFKIYSDTDTERNLYERSDNFPFALAKVPAHTIMTADDKSKCYHQACDEFANVDMENIDQTVNAIITATITLVNGVDDPRKRKKKK